MTKPADRAAERIEPEAQGFERVLVIGAHPDDAEFYAGATLTRLARAGAHVSLLVMTDGQRGGKVAGNLAPVRAGGQVEAAATIGIREHKSLGRADGELVREMELLAELVLAIRTFRPDLVLTHDARTRFTVVEGIAQPGHSDHRATGEMVLDAVAPRAPLPSFFPEQLEQPGVELWYPREVWLFDTTEPDVAVDVAPALAEKQASLRAHASQNEKDGLVRWSEKHGDETFARLVLYRRRG